MPLNARQIEAFRAIAHAGAVTGAAAALHISQPAVSRLLARLEDQLKFDLFARSKGRLQLTPEGVSFLREVDRHFSGLDALAGAADRIAEHGPETLRIVGFPSITNGVLPKAIARHLARHPQTQISLDTDTTDRIAPQVLAGQYDVGFAAGGANDDLPADVRVVASRPWVCVAPPAHRLAARARTTAAELGDEALVAFSPNMTLRASVDRLFATSGVIPDYQVAAQTIESICALVAEGSGVAIIHPYATHIANIFGLRSIAIEDAASLDLAAITPKPPFRSRIVDELVDDVEAIIQQTAR